MGLVYCLLANYVALLTESVDWNQSFQNLKILWYCRSPHGERGLKLTWFNQAWHILCSRSPHGERGLKCRAWFVRYHHHKSLSSRRAWIEIPPSYYRYRPKLVALLTESVDWNSYCHFYQKVITTSLSSRRAWIEIVKNMLIVITLWVALLTESVDWNQGHRNNIVTIAGRSPHGERGLKFQKKRKFIFRRSRSPHGERGLKLPPTLARRIWLPVALLTESVDWNNGGR